MRLAMKKRIAIDEKKYNVLLTTEVSNMTAGAAYSFIELAEWIEKKSEYHVIALLKKKKDLYIELKKRGIESYVIPQRRKWYKKIGVNRKDCESALKELARQVLIPIDLLNLKLFMKKKGINIVHVNGITSGMSAEVAIKLEIPVVWHIRECLEEGLLLEFADRNHAISTINRASHIIAVSEAVKQKYQYIFKPKIAVVYNAFDIGNVSGEKKIDSGKFKICLVGRIIRHKGQIELIRAIGLLPKEKIDKCEVHFIGFEEEKDYIGELKAEIAKYDLIEGKHIFFDGFIPNASEIMANYDCVCVCSMMEAFGRTTVEGMLNKCIVIGANTGGTCELINDGSTGLVYEYGNPVSLSEKILYCMDHKDEVERIRNNGYKYAKEKFMIDSVYSKILEIYGRYVM